MSVQSYSSIPKIPSLIRLDECENISPLIITLQDQIVASIRKPPWKYLFVPCRSLRNKSEHIEQRDSAKLRLLQSRVGTSPKE